MTSPVLQWVGSIRDEMNLFGFWKWKQYLNKISNKYKNAHSNNLKDDSDDLKRIFKIDDKVIYFLHLYYTNEKLWVWNNFDAIIFMFVY